MKSRNESKMEMCSETEESRKEAGFEWAAEPNEVILFFPTIYYMIGVATLTVILSIIYWIGTYILYDYFIWSTIATLFMGLIIVLPQYFSNIINFAINLCCWTAFSVYAIVRVILFIANKEEMLTKGRALGPEVEEMAKRMISYGLGCGIPIFLLTLIVVLLMSRMTLHYYRNR